MRALQMLVPCVVVGVVAVACGGEGRPAASAAETTSAAATPSPDTTRDEMARLQRERDEARIQLADERSARERERQSAATEKATRVEQDGLQARALAAIAKADQALQAQRDKAARATLKQKKLIEQGISDAQQAKAKLETDLQRIHEDMGQSWESFRADVESTMNRLEQSLSEEHGAAPEEKKAKPKPMTEPKPKNEMKK